MARAGADNVKKHLAEAKGTVLFEHIESWAMEAIHDDVKKTISVFLESQTPVV